MSNETNRRDCEHGNQRGKCDSCDLTAAHAEIERWRDKYVAAASEIAALEAENEKLTGCLMAEQEHVEQLKKTAETVLRDNSTLVSEIERLVRDKSGLMENARHYEEEIRSLQAEIERLRAELRRYAACGAKRWRDRYDEATSEIERLKAELAEARAEIAHMFVERRSCHAAKDAEIERLKADNLAAFERGITVNKAFHDIAVKQRDQAYTEIERLKRSYSMTIKECGEAWQSTRDARRVMRALRDERCVTIPLDEISLKPLGVHVQHYDGVTIRTETLDEWERRMGLPDIDEKDNEL